MLLDLPTIILCSIFWQTEREFLTTGIQICLQCDAPYRGHLTKFFLQIIRQSECENLIDSHACSQNSHGSRLNTVAWVADLTYLHVVVNCENLLGGHGKARWTVKEHTLNLTVSGEVLLVTNVE